ncbi:MAG: chemotaxis protein CheW [Bradyrhizobium sp.]
MASPRHQTRKKAVASTAADDRAASESDVASENFLIFRIAKETFGLRLATVAEIARLPDLAHMPLVPPCLLGLANLRGTVLPVMSLRVLLRLPHLEANEQSRLIILRGDAPVGLVVDQIERLTQIAPSQLESNEADMDSALDGVIKGVEGESTIKILNPPRLLAGEFPQLGVTATGAAGRPLITTTASAAAPARALVSLLSLSLGQQEYALPLDRVREIIPLPDYIAELPRPETAVLGVVTLRDRLLPIVSLRALLGLPPAGEREQRSKIVVVSLGGGIVGVVADATREILRVDPDIIDPAPALLTRGEGEAEISSICRVDNGQRLIALLSPDHLFRPDLVRRILAEQGIANEPQSQPETSAMAHEQFIIFRLGKQDYGIAIAAVAEIARPSEVITRLPKAPAFIDGVMNLCGAVVPIINLRRRFDLGATEHAGSQRILIVAVGGITAGFLVDGVSEIMKAQIDTIQPAPEVSQEQMRLISRVINSEADGRLILLVDPTQLLDKIEADVLAKFERSVLDPPVTAP